MEQQSKNTKKNKNSRVEIVIDNFVDRDIQLMLRPLNFMQTIILGRKYTIENDFIKQNSFLSNCMSLCGTICVICLYLYRVLEYSLNAEVKKFVHILYIISYYDFCFYFIGFSLNSFTHLIQVKRNIKFVLTFQSVHRFLNNEKQFKIFTIGNWIAIIYISGLYIILGFFLFVYILKLSLCNVLSCLFLICFDGNMIYAVRCMQLLKDKVELWNKELLNPPLLESRDNKIYCKSMFQAYKNILECYNLYKMTSKHMVFYYIIELFSHALIYVQMLIEMLKLSSVTDNITIPTTLVAVYLWLLKTFMLQTILYLYCEKFYTALSDSQDACALVLNSNCTDEERKLCKNIGRLYRASFKKMSACGLFYIDAVLPLSLLSLLTNHTIVLLQFAFL